MSIEFFVAGVPQPQGSSSGFLRGGKVVVTSANPRLKAWRAAVAQVAAGRVQSPIDGPCMTEMWFYLPRPKSHYGTGRNAGKLVPSAPAHHTTKPDADKLERAVNDSLTTAGIWTDDCVVTDTARYKAYAFADGARPWLNQETGVRVVVTPL